MAIADPTPISVDQAWQIVSHAVREVLRGTTFSRMDNFIDIGGNSLLATMVADRVSSSAGVSVGAEVVLEVDALFDLAHYVVKRAGVNH